MRPPKGGRPPLDEADDDEIERRVAAVARVHGIPSLTTPAPPEPEVVARPAEAPPAPSERADLRSLRLEVPSKLFSALGADAARRGVTKRYLILKALSAMGYEIDEADMEEDGRRLRGSRAVR